MQKIIATVLVSLLLVPATSFAQQSTFTHRRLMDRFETRSSQALLEAATREARLVAAKDGSNQAPSRRSNAARGIWTGALVGAAVGFLVMSTTADCTTPGGYCGLYQLTGAGVGAGAGAAVGFFVGK